MNDKTVDTTAEVVTSPTPEAAKAPFIVKVDLFRDENTGLVIEQTTPIQSLADIVTAGAFNPVFTAAVSININTPQGPAPIQLHVPIEAPDIQAAFANFREQAEKKIPDLAKKKVEEIQAHMRKSALASGGRTPLVPSLRG